MRLFSTTASRMTSRAALNSASAFFATTAMRKQSSAMSSSSAIAPELSHDTVWGLWNEGNLFSMTVAQLDNFLTKSNCVPDPSKKKAMLVRQVEELLQAKDNAAKGVEPLAAAPGSRGGGMDRRGTPASREFGAAQPETLLDLTQSGFYDSPTAMAPKAFQLLVTNATADVVVARVNTTAFPGHPANAECYTLNPADATLAVRTRFAKALQWCVLNMSNLRLDGELVVDFGKLLIHANVVKKNRRVVSAYTLQQRMQVQTSPATTWVSAVAESSVPAIEALLAEELFSQVGKPQTSYDVHIRRAKDTIEIEMNSKGQVTSVNNQWHAIQTSHIVNADSIDTRVLLRTRQALRRAEVEQYSNCPILKLSAEDINDVLAPEHGQVVYVSENVSRRWEKRQTLSGARISLMEIKRQPLIVVHDEEEDPRLEYRMMVSVPAVPTEKIDLRLLSLEVFDIAKLFAEAMGDGFVKKFQCEAQPVAVKDE